MVVKCNSYTTTLLCRWKTDQEFARPVLNGALPSVIERCSQLPSYCNISGADCVLPQGVTLEEEMEVSLVKSLNASGIYRRRSCVTKYLTSLVDFLAAFAAKGEVNFWLNVLRRFATSNQIGTKAKQKFVNSFDNDMQLSSASWTKWS